MEPADRIAELSSLFTILADHDFHDYSPLYERIARDLAASPDLLGFVDDAAAPNSRRGRVPVLFHATLHDQALRHPDSALATAFAGAPMSDAELRDAIRSMLEEHDDEVVSTMRSRSVQTNEVGRSAALVVGLAAVADTIGDDRPVALVELGPSAGLNLFPDRWHVDFVRDGDVVASTGPDDSTVRLCTELRGPSSPPSFTLPPIASRTGIDPAPIDASDSEQSRWLRACVWPDVPERPERLAAALAVVAQHPPPLLRGDAVTDLAPLVASVDDRQFPVVQSTWALAYVSAEGRAQVVGALDALGATRDLAFLTLEEPRFTPWLELSGPSVSSHYAAGDGTPTLLGLRLWRDGTPTSVPLALTHPHVRWLHWLEEVHA